MNWNKKKALQKLNITQVPFDPNGEYEREVGPGLMGHSHNRVITVRNEGNYTPAAVGFHEIAHIVLGHTAGYYDRNNHYQYCRGEMEAYATSSLVLDKLGLTRGKQQMMEGFMGMAFKGGYWNNLPEDFNERVHWAANLIVEAGAVEEEFAKAA